MENHEFADWYSRVGFIWICLTEIQQKAPAKFSLTGALTVIPLGFEPRTTTLKV